ncbi:hypothetical protein [Bradyrhizobium cenepequi]|uniref:hypothetical protein n=1 Tax=Bradyrhizobium cenepequi TaxID=2821403 RepID=UPI001CE38044|nr:hypothetical protein [Bradyrhizobium cenepequi]
MPRLRAAGWDDAPPAINEQCTFTDGRVTFVGGRARRGRQKRADYILRFSADYPIAVVEAKASSKSAGNGQQQARDYAEILGLKFAFANNGADIVEFDFFTGSETLRADFPAPAELRRASARASACPTIPRRIAFSRQDFPTLASRFATIRRTPSIKRCKPF